MTEVAVTPYRVERWSPGSIAFSSSLAALIVLLVFVPLVLGENAMDKLTSIFILVILAVMWNVLAGFAGATADAFTLFDDLLHRAAHPRLILQCCYGGNLCGGIHIEGRLRGH